MEKRNYKRLKALLNTVKHHSLNKRYPLSIYIGCKVFLTRKAKKYLNRVGVYCYKGHRDVEDNEIVCMGF
jgi:hypothetical protein